MHRLSWLLAAALAQVAASPGPGRTTGSVALGWRHENGVESRAIVTARAVVPVHARVRLGADIAFSVLEHNGLAAYGLDADVAVVRSWDAGIELAFQHEQWNDWRLGENRVLGLLSARPLGRFDVGVGAAWRAPLLDPDRYRSPVAWRSDAPELNLVYRARWFPLAAERGTVSVGVSNLAGLRLYGPYHIAAQLDGRYGICPGWRLTARAGTALKGLSALMFSIGEFEFAAGAVHEF